MKLKQSTAAYVAFLKSRKITEAAVEIRFLFEMMNNRLALPLIHVALVY